MLRTAAQGLSNLRRLTLWGCTRVTKSSVYKVLEQAEDIQELSLDATPHSVGRAGFTLQVVIKLILQHLLDLSRAPNISSLHTLSLSIQCPAGGDLDRDDLPRLPPLPNLEALHLTLSGEKRFLPSPVLLQFGYELGDCSIKRLSLLNILLYADQLSIILQSHPGLRELYISITDHRTLRDCVELRGNDWLEVFHVNPDYGGVEMDLLVELASGMSALQQIGVGNRVYEVSRRFDDDDEDKVVIELYRWSRTDTPGYFQIWRG